MYVERVEKLITLRMSAMPECFLILRGYKQGYLVTHIVGHEQDTAH